MALGFCHLFPSHCLPCLSYLHTHAPIPLTPPHYQGALDGGLDIPHNEKRFVGWTKEDGLEAEVLKKYIYGGHVSEYMEEMEEEDPEKYNRCGGGRAGGGGAVRGLATHRHRGRGGWHHLTGGVLFIVDPRQADMHSNDHLCCVHQTCLYNQAVISTVLLAVQFCMCMKCLLACYCYRAAWC